MKGLSSEVERRHRLATRALPLTVLAVAAFALGASTGAPGEAPERGAAERFAGAWARHEFVAMYRDLNPASKRAIGVHKFARAYREAEGTATLRSLKPSSSREPVSIDGVTTVPVAIAANTLAFGPLQADLDLPFAEGGVAWNRSLVFPGLRRGEHLQSRIELATRASILANDGTPLAEGPADARSHPIGAAAIDVTGEVGPPEAANLPALERQGFAPYTPVGVSGLEKAFNARLAGKPGGSLLAAANSGGASRTLASSPPRPGAPVKTTIEPRLQSAAVAALGGRAGGIAVLNASSGDVLALAGQAFSAPQPPGSTFKIVTTTAALEKGVVSLTDTFPDRNGVSVGGRFINNANGEYCGGTFRQAFAESCNADFVPLGPKIGNDALVGTAERFGFNSYPSLYAPRIVHQIEPPKPSIPKEIGNELDLGVSAIGQGEVLATPLEMASVAQTLAAGGVRKPTAIVTEAKLRPQTKPVRVTSKKIAGELTELMIGVVRNGTGTAAAIPQGQVAGKTGTAELGPKPGQQNSSNPVQYKDAWFSAFVPAGRPKLAIGVLFIDAEAAGGEVAAPAAAKVLSAGL
ncbi:MAG TPA: penicillin-binding transpeptidase domain-containing protein [Solirubrobacterales bacterium]|nr:penicillin-binding transpeptidase domain-containing protein [Solirubrobacterales bacterium]